MDHHLRKRKKKKEKRTLVEIRVMSDAWFVLRIDWHCIAMHFNSKVHAKRSHYILQYGIRNNLNIVLLEIISQARKLQYLETKMVTDSHMH